MMRFCVLASGSKGNATYVEGGGVRLLIDAGLSCRALEQRLAARGIDPAGLDAILITHEHTDHIGGLDRFAARYHLPVYANEGTASVVERQCLQAKREPPAFALFESGVPFALGALTVCPVQIPHDTAEPVAFTLSDGERQLGYFTDLGTPTQSVALAIAQCHSLILESNHDLDLLRTSGRPYSLVSRISGTSGHLSNEQASQLIAHVCPPQLCQLILAHLSLDCNQPDVALQVMRHTLQTLHREDVALTVAQQNTPLDWMEV